MIFSLKKSMCALFHHVIGDFYYQQDQTADQLRIAYKKNEDASKHPHSYM
jgi:hypothetical protein